MGTFLDGNPGTEVLQKHPHPTINSIGGREGWVSLGVSIEVSKQLECSSPHDVSYEPGCDSPCMYVQTKSYSHTNAEELAPTATETQGYPSKGYEDEETARIFKLKCHQKELLIPQVRPAHKYPNSPWEMIHPPGGDNAVCM
jgi:hypothetical protein